MKTKSKPSDKKTQPGFPLPQPMELAQLAAALAPGAPPSKALNQAMELYVESVMFCRELPSGADDIIAQYGCEERLNGDLDRLLEERENDTLYLDTDPKKSDDAVRSFLGKHDLVLKTARAVLLNAHAYLSDRPNLPLSPREDPGVVIKAWKRDGGYAIPRYRLELMAKRAKHRRSDSKRKGHETRQKKSPVP